MVKMLERELISLPASFFLFEIKFIYLAAMNLNCGMHKL